MSNRAKYEETRNRIQALRVEMRETCKKVFSEGSQRLFEENPNLICFSWRQYTPYFNDGDVCTFRTDTDYPDVNDYGFDYGEDEDNQIEMPELSKAEYDRLVEKVSDFLSVFEDDDLKAMFDDHAEVFVTRAGVRVEEYDHD